MTLNRKQLDKGHHSKTRILHLLASDRFSGAENVACGIIRSTRNKFDVAYCSPSGSIDESLKNDGITKINIAKLTKQEVARVIDTWRPDIIHAHDFRASVIASRFSNEARIISHIHQNPDWLDNRISVNYLLYKIVLPRISKVVVVSNEIKARYMFRNMNDTQVSVAYNIVDKDKVLASVPKNIKKKYDLVYCGRLEEIKNPLAFIHIVKKISKSNENIKAVMVGDGALSARCCKEIERLGLQGTIEMVGFQTNPYKYIASSRFIIIPSKLEGFGLVAVEAMILGTAVLAFNVPGLREILGTTKNTLYDTQVSLVNDYKKLNNLKSLYTTHVRANRRLSQYFTQESVSLASLFSDIYNNTRIDHG